MNFCFFVVVVVVVLVVENFVFVEVSETTTRNQMKEKHESDEIKTSLMHYAIFLLLVSLSFSPFFRLFLFLFFFKFFDCRRCRRHRVAVDVFKSLSLLFFKSQL